MKLLGFFTLLLSFLFASNVMMVPNSMAIFTHSAIRIVSPINIEETSKLDFGVIETPSETSNLVINYNGSLSGDANIIDSSTSSRAQFLLTGSDFQNVGIQVEYLENVQFINFNSIEGQIDGTSANLISGLNNVTLTEQGKILDFGANITLLQGLGEGNYSPAIRLSVNYE